MRRISIALFSLVGIVSTTFGQKTNEELYIQFQKDVDNNRQKFNAVQPKSRGIKNLKGRTFENLAGYIGDTPIFYSQADLRANIGTGINTLFTKGISENILDGSGITILVMDGGRVFNEHKEFTPSRIINLENNNNSYSSHATSVTGLITAQGIANFEIPYLSSGARGVLPKSNIKSNSFLTTNNTNNVQKLLKANENISNHSYGVNLGWDAFDDEGDKGPGWYFNVDKKYFDDYKNANLTFSGSYYYEDADLDEVIYSNPKFVVVKSAGNSYGDGPDLNDDKKKYYSNENGDWVEFNSTDILPSKNCANGAYCIDWGSLAKNVIVVGAVDFAKTPDYKYTAPNNVIKAEYSSAGPRKDGAIKPDIVTYGTGLVSPYYDNEDPSDKSGYIVGSGTSYSAPIVTGSVGMLTQLKRILNNDNSYNFFADEAKALLLHTTDEAGGYDGPDNKMGWGLLNTLSAAEILVNDQKIFERKLKKSNVDISYTVVSDGTPLKASISWIDPKGIVDKYVNELFNNTKSKLINDFDLRIVDTESKEIFYPWKLDLKNVTGPAIKGDNTVDNYERVDILNPIKGRKYNIIISNKAKLINGTGVNSDQDVTILVSGIQLDKQEGPVVEENKKPTIIYPTLVKDKIYIETVDLIKKIEVFNINGQLILTAKTNIDASSLVAGIYIIRVTTDKEVLSKKIVKQ